ncbi:MAG: NAD(P)/FAD-dependent oxidoreductase [Clostridiales bacterium]|nr:NAD(P)/FAD-dependent oxidoreductase [Clostridiales bacterium]
MKQVIIIGAGLAGLSAGIYARQSGFDTTIYESHTIPGGASTSWRRKGYYFEGGLHWLTGSSPKSQLHRLWREVGALDDSVAIHNRDPFFSYESDGVRASLYRDIEQLRAHLIALSPADRNEINKLCRDVRKLSKVEMPVLDLPNLKAKNPVRFPLSMLFAMIPAMPRMKYYQNLTTQEYSEKFKSPLIRKLICNMIGDQFNAAGVLFTIATLSAGDGGYPVGGSIAMAQRMAKKFLSLGGVIQYKTKVDQVVVENGVVKGVMIHGEMIAADAVIVTKDTLSAIDDMFAEPIREPWAEQMRMECAPMLNVFIGLGVQADLSDLPANCTFPTQHPIRIGDLSFNSISYNNYTGFEGYAPEDGTALTLAMTGDSYDFWKKCREDGTYEAEKQKLADAVIHELEAKYPQISGKIVVCDVATPLTYERYLGSFKGSWMTVTKKGKTNLRFSCKPESIAYLYFAGQRLMMPGGCPVALSTGRTAVQHLCIDTDTVFQGNL